MCLANERLMLQCNVVSHWLGIYTKWSLKIHRTWIFSSLCLQMSQHLRVLGHQQPQCWLKVIGFLLSLCGYHWFHATSVMKNLTQLCNILMGWLVQERHNSSASAMELHLSYTNPWICCIHSWLCYNNNKKHNKNMCYFYGTYKPTEVEWYIPSQ